MERLGLTLPFPGIDLRASCGLARRAEQAGYTDVWTAEVSGADAFSVAAAVGLATSSVRIGVAIVPVYSRPPALLAMSAAAAQSACGGRFNLGLGASTPTIVEGWMGQRFSKPVTRMAETVEVLRQAFAGDKVSFQGETVTVRGFRLEAPPSPPPPIFLAALGPRMTALAQQVADGIALFAMDGNGVALARAGAPGKELVGRIMWMPGVEPDEARPMAKWLLAPYIAADGYNPWIARQGYEAEAAAVRAAWSSGDRDGARAAVSDRLADALVAYGDKQAVRERLDELRAQGLSTPILLPVSQQGPEATAAAVLDLLD